MDQLSLFPAVGSIAVICYLLSEICKFIPNFNSKALPLICGVLGGLLGGIGFAIDLEAFAGKEVFDCIATGICSGLTSCGAWDLINNLNAKIITTENPSE